MALLKYFKLNKPSLPDPEGPLSAHVSSDCIREANKEVSAALKVKRAPCIKATRDHKAVVGKYAVAHGVVNAIKRYQKDFPGDVLKESTVRGWRDAYRKVVDERVKEAKKRAASPDLDVQTLPKKKCGRPLTLPEEIDMEVQQYILHLHEIGASINGTVVRASARGILKIKIKEARGSRKGPAPTLPILTKDWSRYLLERMQLCQLSLKCLTESHASIKKSFLYRQFSFSVSFSLHGRNPSISHHQLGSYST